MKVDEKSNLTNEELMERYLASDFKAFNELYFRLKPKFMGYFFNKTNDEAKAKDLLQEFFLTFHKNREKYDLRLKLEPWAFTIAHNIFVNYLRKNIHKNEVLTDEIASYEMEFNKNEIENVMKDLSEEEKEFVNLRFFNDLTHKEIAKYLNKSEDAIRKYGSRLLKNLRGVFKNEKPN